MNSRRSLEQKVAACVSEPVPAIANQDLTDYPWYQEQSGLLKLFHETYEALSRTSTKMSELTPACLAMIKYYAGTDFEWLAYDYLGLIAEYDERNKPSNEALEILKNLALGRNIRNDGHHTERQQLAFVTVGILVCERFLASQKFADAALLMEDIALTCMDDTFKREHGEVVSQALTGLKMDGKKSPIEEEIHISRMGHLINIIKRLLGKMDAPESRTVIEKFKDDFKGTTSFKKNPDLPTFQEVIERTFPRQKD